MRALTQWVTARRIMKYRRGIFPPPAALRAATPPPQQQPPPQPPPPKNLRLPREPEDFNTEPAEPGGLYQQVVSPAISTVFLIGTAVILAALARGCLF